MAVQPALERAHTDPLDEELNDGQIEELLARATARLQSKAATKPTKPASRATKSSSSKFDTRALDGNHALINGEVSKINTASLTDAKVTKNKADGMRVVQDPVAMKRMAEERKKATAGKDWFDLPKTNLTPELKRDLQLLKMRGVLDPHRHYKKDGGKLQAPEYSQVGTIVEGPTEFFSGRIENKKRKRTFVEEVLAGDQETKRFKRKYGELQDKKTSGKKAFYKALKAKRRNGVKKGG